MSKAVMKSAPPRLCKKIASGECTMLLSKIKPKLNTPFKCYIYMTMNGLSSMIAVKTKQGFVMQETHKVYPTMANGRVICEFVCDNVETYKYDYCDGVDIDDDTLLETTFDIEEINIYAKGKTLYGLHISQLKIYDKPKEVSEFYKLCVSLPTKRRCEKCEYKDNIKECFILSKRIYLKKAFPNFGYVEELEE